MRALPLYGYVKFTYNNEAIEGIVTSQNKETIWIDSIPYEKAKGFRAKVRYYLLKVDKGVEQKTINSTFRTLNTDMIDTMYMKAYKDNPNRRIYIQEMFL